MELFSSNKNSLLLPFSCGSRVLRPCQALWAHSGLLRIMKAQNLLGKQEMRWMTVRQGQKLEPGAVVAKMWFPKATRDRDSRQAS